MPVLSPKPTPRQTDAVVVMAQEALAAAALSWQERAERLEQANTRLKNRVAEVEESHRKSLTVVKNVPALPNNHVFTKQLVDENHALRRETRALQRRLMQFEGPGATNRRLHPIKQRSSRVVKGKPSTKPNKVTKEDGIVNQKETTGNQEHTATSLTSSDLLVVLAQHPLLQELKTHLKDLEVDLDRLQQENELLRGELIQYQEAKKTTKMKVSPQNEEDNNVHIKREDQEQLQASVDALLQQIKVLEARYQHLEEKARSKTVLYQESTSRLEEIATQLFEAQQQLATQAEKLQVHSDQASQLDDLQQELHLLRSENVKLNETIATLSSRPFDVLSKDLQKKNLCIVQLEEEKRTLEQDLAKFQADCITTRRTNNQLRRRVENISAEVNDLANELTLSKTQCEQKTMEIEVAQLQLRFYTAPGDHDLMSAIGKAIKDMKKQQFVKAEDKPRVMNVNNS